MQSDNYITFINKLINRYLANKKNTIAYGQNICTGSSFSGMTRNILSTGCKVINSQDSENLLTGLGYGMLLNNQSSVYFLKQQDFLFLGLDHMVNSHNLIKLQKKFENNFFTIFFITVDSGFEGPQSRINKLPSIASLTNIKSYCISNQHDAELIFKNYFSTKGVNLISISQRMFKKTIISSKYYKLVDKVNCIIEYSKGLSTLILSTNFAFVQTMEFIKNNKLKEKFAHAHLSSHNFIKNKKSLSYFSKFKKIIVVNDAKSGDYKLLICLFELEKKILYLENLDDLNNLTPNEDKYIIDMNTIKNFMK